MIFQTESLEKVRDALKAYAKNNFFALSTSNKSDISDTDKRRRLVMISSLSGISPKQKWAAKAGNSNLTCGGKSQGKLQNICKGSEHIKPRTSSSLKCQCAWEIVVKYNQIENVVMSRNCMRFI